MTLEMNICNWHQILFVIMVLSTLEKKSNIAFHLNNIEFPSPRDALYHVFFKTSQVKIVGKLLNVVKVYSFAFWLLSILA